MDAPALLSPRTVAPDTTILPGWLPIPGFGLLAVNAFLIEAAQPVLIDTGLLALADDFVDRLRSRMDLRDLRWIYLTHADPDHLGALSRLLKAAPNARVVTTFLGMAKVSLAQPLPPERVFLLNPGQELDLGDRKLAALRPPTWDAPETTALLDRKTRALFSADSFGALLDAVVDEADAVPAAALREGMVRWGTIDAPWLHLVDPAKLQQVLGDVAALQPSVVLSAHLPPARGILDAMLRNVADVPAATPFVGPDQEAMMAAAGG